MATAEVSDTENAFKSLTLDPSVDKHSLSVQWIYGPPGTDPEAFVQTYLKAWAAVFWGRSTMLDSTALLFWHPIGNDLTSDGYWYKSAPSAASLRLAIRRARDPDGAPRMIFITDRQAPDPSKYPKEIYDMIEEIDLGQKMESDSELSVADYESDE